LTALRFIVAELCADAYKVFRDWSQRQPIVSFAFSTCVILGSLRVLVALLTMFPVNESGTTTLRGMLRIDGTEVTEGTLQFMPLGKGRPAAGQVRKGLFVAQGVAVGPARVICHAIKETGKIIDEGGHVFPERISIVPEKYREGFEFVVAPNAGHVVFDLKSEAATPANRVR